jgi:hypothetical protein
MNSGLLVPHQDVLNRVLFVKSVINVENSSAGITPNVLDTFGLKRLDKDFCATEFLWDTRGLDPLNNRDCF